MSDMTSCYSLFMRVELANFPQSVEPEINIISAPRAPNVTQFFCRLACFWMLHNVDGLPRNDRVAT